jgi:dihydrofolate reductase
MTESLQLSGSHPTIKAIVAMADNRVIGANGTLPWHLPEDLKFFKQTTLGGVLVMGRKTFDSIGRPLPGRETIVISRKMQSIPGLRVVDRIEAVLELQTDKAVWVVGGAEIYRQMLPFCSEILVTRVSLSVAGDTFFPAFEDDFKLVGLLAETPQFRIEHYKRPLEVHRI